MISMDDHTRMLVYRNIDDRWLPEGAEDLYLYRGMGMQVTQGIFLALDDLFVCSVSNRIRLSLRSSRS